MWVVIRAAYYLVAMRRSSSQDFRSSLAEPPVVASETVAGVYASYAWLNVAIIIWFGPATIESVAVFERGCKAGRELFPQGMSSIHIMVPGGRSLPSSEARSELIRVFREYAPQSAANAVIIPGTGFWAGAMRSLITALCVLARTTTSPHVFADASEVSEWLPPVHFARTGVQLNPHRLSEVLQQISRDADIRPKQR